MDQCPWHWALALAKDSCGFFVLTHDVSHNKLFAHDLWVCETNETKMKRSGVLLMKLMVPTTCAGHDGSSSGI